MDTTLQKRHLKIHLLRIYLTKPSSRFLQLFCSQQMFIMLISLCNTNEKTAKLLQKIRQIGQLLVVTLAPVPILGMFLQESTIQMLALVQKTKTTIQNILSMNTSSSWRNRSRCSNSSLRINLQSCLMLLINQHRAATPGLTLAEHIQISNLLGRPSYSQGPTKTNKRRILTLLLQLSLRLLEIAEQPKLLVNRRK